MDYLEPLVSEIFSSAFVDDTLFIERLGGPKSDPRAVQRYLDIPIGARPQVSPFFDREFYWRRYADIKAADIDPLVHFMRWGVVEKRNPHPLISIDYIGVVSGLLPDPITVDALYDILCRDRAHPGPYFDLDHYRKQLTREDAPQGGLLRHFLEVGLLRGLTPSPTLNPIDYYTRIAQRTVDIRSALSTFVLSGGAVQDHGSQPASEAQTKLLFRRKAAISQIERKAHPLRFEYSGVPDISVIMVMHNRVNLTLQALASLRASYPGSIQLVLIDSGSTDETRFVEQYVTGAHLVVFDTNVGFLRGCNVGLRFVTAETLLYLNNDVELAPDAIPAALARLRSNDKIGAVGAKVIRTHGQLQEAGCIMWRDGWGVGYLRDADPAVPEANFVRDVEFCSGVFLLARASLIKELGGFDDAYAPAYYEDSDLCMRIRAAGFRIVYDPGVVVRHLEFGSSEHPDQAHAQIARGHDIFVQKHRQTLRQHYASDARARLFARTVGKGRGRILVIEDQVPLRRLGSGFVRSNDIIRLMAEMGFQVTVFPIKRCEASLAAIYADFPDTVEVMYDRGLTDLERFLGERRGFYQAIWIARTHNLDLVKPLLEAGGVDVLEGVRVILDTEAIAAPREALRRALAGEAEPFDVDAEVEHELRNAWFCQNVVAVSEEEAGWLRKFGFADAHVLGHMRAVALTPRPWAERSGMLFVGSVMNQESPNFDSLCWFVDEVLPLVEQKLGWQTRLTIAGHIGAPGMLDRFADHARVTLLGEVPDLTTLYDRHRVFVAPTRFAAGVPYKIHEAASLGLPVVATELLRRELGWDNGEALLSAEVGDAEGFAAQVLALHESEALWEKIRASAAERVASECDAAKCEKILSEILT